MLKIMTDDKNPLKEYIKLEDVNIEKLCEDIRKHAIDAKTEEDLRIRVESTLRPILEKWGIQWASYEHSNKISGIRKDALYGTVIIEYKAPQKLESKREFEKGKEQVKKYIAEEAMDPQYYGRYFGILIDGFKIAFIRYRKNDWEEPDVPLDLTPRTVLRILEAIRGLQRKPIDAPEDFNIVMRLGVKKYYSRCLGFIAAGVLSLILAIIIYFNSYSDSIIWSLIGGLFLMAFITFIGAIALYLDYRSMQHHPDNQIF